MYMAAVVGVTVQSQLFRVFFVGSAVSCQDARAAGVVAGTRVLTSLAVLSLGRHMQWQQCVG
jgi:hypothetical protein